MSKGNSIIHIHRETLTGYLLKHMCIVLQEDEKQNKNNTNKNKNVLP